MHQLVYASKTGEHFKADAVGDILSVARRKNEASGLSGILFFSPKYFLQCLEGPQAALNQTFQRICLDERHSDIRILRYRETACRQFEKWTMGSASSKQVNRMVYFKYFDDDILNPFNLKEDGCLEFLGDLRRNALILDDD